MAEELINAREAMDLLGIAEGELQNMVARGDLRAFRAAGTMKFRRDDVLSMKSEKETQPTIIIPASTTKRPGQSGIIGPVAAPAAGPVASSMAEAPISSPSPMRTPQPTAPRSDATEQIVLDTGGQDVVLMPPDDGLATQQATAVNVPVAAPEPLGLPEPGVITAHSGEMTVVDQEADQGKVPTGVVPPVTAPPSRPAPAIQTGSRIGPAVSRIRTPSVVAARRTAAVFQEKTAHPIWTALLVVNAAVALFALSIVGVAALQDQTYRPGAGQPAERFIPPYMQSLDFYTSYKNGHEWFRWLTGTLPGDPQLEPGAAQPTKTAG